MGLFFFNVRKEKQQKIKFSVYYPQFRQKFGDTFPGSEVHFRKYFSCKRH